MVLLGDSHVVAGLDAELRHLFGIVRANIQAERSARPTRPGKVGFLPTVRQLQHARMHAVGGVHQCGMSHEEGQHPATFLFEFQAAIRQDGVDFVADLILVGNHQHARRAARWPPLQDQVP